MTRTDRFFEIYNTLTDAMRSFSRFVPGALRYQPVTAPAQEAEAGGDPTQPHEFPATSERNRDSGRLAEALGTLLSEPSHSRILSGSLVMLVGSGLVSLVNLGYNVAVARMLDRALWACCGCGHAADAGFRYHSGFSTAMRQTGGRSDTPGARSAVFRPLLWRAWIVGLGLGSGLALPSPLVTLYLNLPSRSLVLMLAAGVAFYVPLGVKRGGFQGVCAFSRLTVNFVVEVLLKFTGAIVLIELGYGVAGAVAAIAASVALAYFLPPMPGGIARPAGARPGRFVPRRHAGDCLLRGTGDN